MGASNCGAQSFVYVAAATRCRSLPFVAARCCSLPLVHLDAFKTRAARLARFECRLSGCRRPELDVIMRATSIWSLLVFVQLVDVQTRVEGQVISSEYEQRWGCTSTTIFDPSLQSSHFDARRQHHDACWWSRQEHHVLDQRSRRHFSW